MPYGDVIKGLQQYEFADCDREAIAAPFKIDLGVRSDIIVSTSATYSLPTSILAHYNYLNVKNNDVVSNGKVAAAVWQLVREPPSDASTEIKKDDKFRIQHIDSLKFLQSDGALNDTGEGHVFTVNYVEDGAAKTAVTIGDTLMLPFRVTFMDIPHHGSVRDSHRDLFKWVRAGTYGWSSNGGVSYTSTMGDGDVVNMIVEAHKLAKEKANICFTFDKWTDKIAQVFDQDALDDDAYIDAKYLTAGKKAWAIALERDDPICIEK